MSFSRDGKRLLLVVLRGQERTPAAVVIHLETGNKEEVPHGPGLLGHASLVPDGRWAVLGVVAQDSNGDGQLTWPQMKTSLAPRRCRGPVLSYGRYGFSGDTPTFALRRVSGGPLFQMNEVLLPLGELAVRRDAKGALFVENSVGQRTEWVPASCGARLLHADAEREQVLVACMARENMLEVHGARVHQSLGLSVEPPPEEEPSSEPTRLIPVSAAAPAGADDAAPQHLVDLESRVVHPVPVPGRVSHTDGTRALVVQYSAEGQPQTLWLVDVASGEKRELGPVKDSSIKTAGHLVSVGELLVDMSSGKLLGRIGGDVEALDAQGRTLRAAHQESLQEAQGPLQWVPAIAAEK
ncbi:hypothetical protein P2318_24565 [Myxococcaceae bacterium GXIMD 01537]